MDWEDYHLHQFLIGKRIYSMPGPDDDLYELTIIDESRERLSDVVPRVGTTFTYLYDFGDNWRHDLLLEAITMPEAPGHYPQCIAGERRTPPEDVGGGSGMRGIWKPWAIPMTTSTKTCCTRGARLTRRPFPSNQ